MKKVIALLVVLAMLFAFAACGGNTPANNNAVSEVKMPKKVTVLVPQATGAVSDQTARIMVDYMKKIWPDTKFDVENTTGNGNDHITQLAKAPGDGSVLFMLGSGCIASYYSQDWDYNISDQDKFVAIAGNVGQLQPSGGVFLINAEETRFNDIPSLIAYIKAHPGEVRCSYGTGTPHEVRLKLILNYFGVKTEDVKFLPGATTEIRAWIQGKNTDVCVLTETTAAADIKGGKVKGILNSVNNRDLYTPDLEPLKDVPVVCAEEVEGIKKEDEASLICAWPMTIYGPASMSKELVEYINISIKDILNDPESAERIAAIGGTTTYQYFTVEEINKIQQDANAQIKKVYEAFQ